MIPFNKPYITGLEEKYISEAVFGRSLSGNGAFTQRCTNWLVNTFGCHDALLTHSCTAALEMCAMLLDLKPGDEVIMPSYTFVSTANAFVLRGATPVFVDIDRYTLNVDSAEIEKAITDKTKCVVIVHYAGMACETEKIVGICKSHGIPLVEDAAQAILSSDNAKRLLGSIGDLACLSFHETKNISCGEGGALLINNKSLADRAHILHEKGTDRNSFLSGRIDKYTWQDIGSSYPPSELCAAYLFAQLESAQAITEARRKIWSKYHNLLHSCGLQNITIPTLDLSTVDNNAHIYYILAKRADQRAYILKSLAEKGVMALFHYVPLHTSPAGMALGKVGGSLENTDSIARRIVRLPMWIELDPTDVVRAVKEVDQELSSM